MSDLIKGNSKGQENNGLSKFEYVPTYSLSANEQSGSGGLDPKKFCLYSAGINGWLCFS